MRILSIDIETYSSADLKSCGVYKYTEAQDFAILLFGYAFDDDPVKVLDLTKKDLPENLVKALADPAVTKTAYNAMFERVCLSKYLGKILPPEQWDCTMVKAAYYGYPFGLDAVAKAMDMEEKDKAGKTLIRYFSMPCKPTKANSLRVRNHPGDDPEKWQAFMDYCGQDVIVERNIRRELNQLPLSERKMYAIDQQINDRGVLVDMPLVASAIDIFNNHADDLIAEASELTNISNPNSAAQLKDWLSEQTGDEINSLNKQNVAALLEEGQPEEVQRVLKIRSELAKTSIKKYHAMMNAACADGRVRGLFQFYGASRTGRWAGRMVQVQNLPQNHLNNLDTAREVIRTGDKETAHLFFDNIPDTLSQLIRTAFIPSPGKQYVVVDFSAIEARIIAWLAGERWRLEVFATHGKIYEASASQMFGVALESITKDSPLRQKGKVSELALGYQGGPGALIAMGALGMGISEEELPGIVNAWRRANRKIVKLWSLLQDAAVEAIRYPGVTVKVLGKIEIRVYKNNLIITLPSGRELYYLKPGITEGYVGAEIHYKGINQTNKKWQNLKTYGGKIAENCLAGDAMVLTPSGWKAIREVTKADLVWDGDKWVTHEGLSIRGYKNTINLNGVRLTPDHKILTKHGWENASSCQEHSWYEVKLPDSPKLHRLGRKKIFMENSLPMRKRNRDDGNRISKRQTKILRLQKKRTDRSYEQNPRHVKTRHICRLEKHESAMYKSESQGLAQLRRTRYYRVQRVVGRFQKFFKRYVTDIPERVGDRPHRQQPWLLQNKLPVGHPKEKRPKQKNKSPDTYFARLFDCGRNRRKIRHQCDHYTLSGEQQGTRKIFTVNPGFYEPVYDLINCGDQQRFTVLSDSGPMIVHNCVQAIARDCLADAVKRLDDAGYKIVMHVHDEVVLEGEENDLGEVIEVITQPMPWAKDLLLKADGFVSKYYKK